MSSGRALEIGAGVALLAAYALHVTVLAGRGAPTDALWMCHVASLLVALGLLVLRPELIAVGFLWQALGTPLWLLDLSQGGELLATSLGTHLGGLAAGLFGVRRLGVPRGTWWRALFGLAGLLLLSRLVTPPAANVNLAFAVWPGWERLFPSHGAYLALLGAVAAATFVSLDATLHRSEPGTSTAPRG